MASAKHTLCYQLRIHLVGSKPEIWRRILVPVDSDLDDLHFAIQSAFEWHNYHLFSFWYPERNGRNAPHIYPDIENWDAEESDEVAPKLADILAVGKTLMYTYDFGDDWEHEILCEALMIKPPRIRLPHCTDGAMNSAFEDVGGIWGYQSMLEVIKNPDNPEYAEQLEWILESFGKRILKYDATAFDPKKIKFG